MKNKIMLMLIPILAGIALLGCSTSRTGGEPAGEESAATEQMPDLPAETEENSDAEAEINEAIKHAVKQYQELLKSDEMHTLTATEQYPRGDSTAVYAFGDCNGDGIPELHIDGGSGYYIYSVQEGQAVLWYTHFSTLSTRLIPLQDGTFLSMTRADRNGEYSLYQKIFMVSGKEQIDTGYPYSREIYSVYRLDENGSRIDSEGSSLRISFERDRQPQVIYEIDGNECSEEDWMLQAELFGHLSEDDSQQLEWKYVFPEHEWAYLDSLEHNDVIPDIFDSREGRAYQQIMTGDFSFVKDLDDQSHLASKYIRSLDEMSGRSDWKYVIRDVNGDGIDDLVIRTNPEEEVYEKINFPEIGNGLLCFSYQDEEINWWKHEISKECFLPLGNGQIILRLWYRNTMTIMIGRWDTGFEFVPERIYEKIYVGYDQFYDEEWYRDFFEDLNRTAYAFGDRQYRYPEGERTEGDYYFVQDCQDGNMTGELTELSPDEWQDIIAFYSDLLIPEDEWNPVSIFMPRREFGDYGVG